MSARADALLDLSAITLSSGSHSSRDKGVCAMEAVAWLAGEPHSDHPVCACPVIAEFLRRWNDDLDDAGRQALKPLLPLVVGTRSTAAVEDARAWLATDWLVRVHTPAWLDLAGLADQAEALRGLPEITPATAKASRPTIDAVRERAAAARDAARAAAWAAARDAAGAAAGDAAWAAAWDAAWASAWAAARDAAKAKLQQTKVSLQQSAVDLLQRLIEAGER